ncbi:hypothetical protein LCGC14_0817320, partial [marine sediment metagenome]
GHDVGKKSKEKAKRKRREEEKALRLGTMYGMGSKSLRGTFHVPNIKKGTYQVGGTVTGRMSYNQSPVEWPKPYGVAKSFGGAMKSIRSEFFGHLRMCGDCISTKVTGSHDRNVHERRVCQLCGTVWPGLEPHNDRRGAIMAQRARKNPFHCSSCQDVGCALCL